MPIAQINGTSLHYHAKGTGTPIVFIHPPLINSAVFRYQQAQLSDEFKVITFDIRGHGHSAASKEPFTYRLIVEDIRQLLDYLDVRKAYVCGYSTGGSIALEALMTYPDRFLGGIVISGMSETSDWRLKSRIRTCIAMSSPLAIRLLRLSICSGNADMGMTFRNLYRHAKFGSIDNIRDYFRCSLTYNCTDRLDYIRAPVLMIYGEKDKSFRRYRDILHEKLPQADLVLVKGKNHQLPTKAASDVNELIRLWVEKQEHKEQADEDMTRSYPFTRTDVEEAQDVLH
jgi:pimeloyl-ACP methyl ester carboxylesterase